MAIEVTIPRLGWSMDEGTFGEWLKADGEFVEAGEAIFALESEKALQEVESVDSGVLRILPNAPQEGDTVTVGTLVAYLLEEGEQIPAESRGIPAPARAAEPEEQPTPQVNPQAVRVNTPGNESRVVRPTISPRAARLAKQSGVDWTTLTGSGTTGRIRERDVRAAMPSGEKPGRVRRVIAERMMHSVSNSAPVTLTTRVDATKLIRLREHYKTESRDFVPAYQDIIAMQVALTLRAHPEMQFQWVNGDIVQPDGIHIGLAVDTTAGLLVPVIRNCDQLSLAELSRTSREQIERARAGTCGSAEVTGGTFTITNLGAFGIDAFTPIINTPQTAILGLGAIRREAVVLDDDRIVARHQMTLSLTFDHRIVDGAPAARFLQSIAQCIERLEDFE